MLGTYALLEIPLSGPLLTLAFCGTVLIYQLDRVLGLSPEDEVNRPGRTRWMQSHRRYVAATIAVAAVVGGGMLTVLKPITALVGCGLGLAGVAHVWPLTPGGHRLKAWGWVKPLAISGVWAAGAVLLPVLEADRPITVGAWALVAYRFGMIGVNTLLADWNDRAGDARVGLQTVATMQPTAVVFGLAYALLALLLAGGVGAITVGNAPLLLLVDLIGVMLMGGVIWHMRHGATWGRYVALDAVVAWPAITFLIAWLGPG
jgi:4-hydroxybenzoate polyprenyltransferase